MAPPRTGAPVTENADATAAPAPGRGAPPDAPPANFGRTMIGIAPLGPAGQAPAAAQASSRAPRGPGGTQHLVSAQKTMLGVARPGIAPLNPSLSKPSTAAPVASPAPARAARNRHLDQPLNARARAPRPAFPAASDVFASGKPRIPTLAAIAMVAAAGLFAAAAVFWLFYRGHGAIEAHAVASASGADVLELECAACDDGTRLQLDAASAQFATHHARLPLTRPLKVGENPMTITLVSPHGKQTFVDISVPIAFRVRGDTSGLEAPSPELRVLVSARPGSAVTVDGKPLALSAAGEGSYAIDVTTEVSGLDPNVESLDRVVPYVVTPPNAAPQSGTVSLHAGITPLVIDAPGAVVVLESSNFVLAGSTAHAGALTVGDRPITVDPTGHFAQMMNVSAPGETTIVVRATSKATAPRLFPLRVRRVDSLAREADRVRQRAVRSYAAIADQPESKRGWAVAFDGSVVDARTENYNTVAVMDVSGGCEHAPCLLRIVYGAPASLARGDPFSAFGEVSGVVDGPRTGTRIPEMRADFLIKANK